MNDKINATGLGAVLPELAGAIAEGLGKAPPRGLGCGPRDDQILRLAAKSPRAAWAELTGAIQAPFTTSIAITFPTTSDLVESGDMDALVLGAETWIKDVVFDIQVPSAFQGNPQKTMYDFFYNKTSGIVARLIVTGRPRYDVTTAFAPLSNLADFIPFNWPDGWLLTKYNGIHMDFQSSATVTQAPTPLPFAPVTVTVTFRGYQYVCPDIDAMPMEQVIGNLADCGYCVDYLRKSRCSYG